MVNQMPNEIWMKIRGYSGLYSVSNHGRVLSERYGRFLHPTVLQRYSRVSLAKKGKTKNHSVHGLVCRAFLGECPAGLEINHNNSNRHHNHVSNLEYITHQKNVHHSILSGTFPLGSRHGRYKHGKSRHRSYLGKDVYRPKHECTKHHNTPWGWRCHCSKYVPNTAKFYHKAMEDKGK